MTPPLIHIGPEPMPDCDPPRMPQYRAAESNRRGAMLSWHSDNRRITRKRHIEGCLIGGLVLFGLFAWWANRPVPFKPVEVGEAIPDASTGAALMAETAPVVWKKPPAKAKRKAVGK